MNKLRLLFLIVLAVSAISLPAKDAKPRKAFDNPDCKAATTSVLKLTRAEFFKDSTRISFDVTFPAGMWINVDTNFVMEINDNVYRPSAVHGLEFGKMFVMPESGVHEFSLVYPGVKGKLSTMSLVERGGTWSLYDIRLDGKRYDRPSPEKWIADNHVDYPGEDATLIYDQPQKSVLRGIIAGYDPRTCGDTFMMYDEDELTSVDRPIVVPVNDDGTFTAELSMRKPKYINVTLANHKYYGNYYFEPGRDLSLFIDLENDKVLFGDELGIINRQLQAAPKFWGYRCIPELADTVPMEQAIEMIEAQHKAYQDVKNEFLNRDDIHPFAKKLVDSEELSGMIFTMLDHDMNLTVHALNKRKLPAAKPDAFWNYIRAYMSNPVFPRTSHYSTMINRLVNTLMFNSPIHVPMEYLTIIGDRGLVYLKEHGYKLTDREEQMRAWIEEHDGEEHWLTLDSVNMLNRTVYEAVERCSVSAEQEAEIDKIVRSYREGPEAYGKASARNFIKTAKTVSQFCGTDEPPLWWQIVLASSLNGSMMSPEKLEQNVSLRLIQQLKDSGAITYAGINNAIYDHYISCYKPTDLPDNEAGRFVKSIIEPYKGKFVLMDLWATSCGPCRSYIMDSQEFRKKNAGNKDFAIVFVTEESLSPKTHYDEFVEKYLQGEDSHRISTSQYYYLRELFAFNGIPHYVMFDRDGKIISKDFSAFVLQNFLKRNGVTLAE